MRDFNSDDDDNNREAGGNLPAGTLQEVALLRKLEALSTPRLSVFLPELPEIKVPLVLGYTDKDKQTRIGRLTKQGWDLRCEGSDALISKRSRFPS